MRVRLNPNTTAVNVRISLGNAVALSDAELWLLAGGNDSQVPRQPLAPQPNSIADWINIPVNGQVMDFTVYWTAFEPLHPTWVYDALIEVTDQNGQLLPGDGGFQNPTTVPSAIGAPHAHFGRGLHPIQLVP